MPVNSKQKGKRGELEAAKMLTELGYPARRSQQYAGYAGTADILCDALDGIHIEVKFGYPLSAFDLGTKRWWDAIEQCTRDSAGQPWLLLWRPKGLREWRATTQVDEDGVATWIGCDGVRSAIACIERRRK